MMKTIYEAAKSVSKLNSFFGTKMIKILEDLSLLKLSVVKDIIDDLEEVGDKRLAINRALTHLEIAHKELYKARLLASLKGISERKIHKLRYQEYICCCLMCLCHLYLNDSKKIIQKNLYWANCALEREEIDDNDFEKVISEDMLGTFIVLQLSRSLREWDQISIFLIPCNSISKIYDAKEEFKEFEKNSMDLYVIKDSGTKKANILNKLRQKISGG